MPSDNTLREKQANGYEGGDLKSSYEFQGVSLLCFKIHIT